MKRLRVLLVTIVAAAYCILPSVIYSCGPWFQEAVFSFKYTPDFSLHQFLNGKLGIVHPGLKQSYLFVAYRYLSGQPLNRGEKAALVDFWTRQQPGYWNGDSQKIAQVWLAARAEVASDKATINIYKSDDNLFIQYPNCQPDAFRTAADTLRARAKQFGGASTAVKHWLAGQDIVFANCNGKASQPGVALANDPPLIRADRDYQIAAAHLYAGQSDVAEEEFRHIAADTNSPWNGIANYLQARAIVRKASLAFDDDKPRIDRPELERAEAILKKVLANEKLRRWHEASRERLGLIRARLHPEERLDELTVQLNKPSTDTLVRQQVSDMMYLMDRNPTRRDTELEDWVATVREMATNRQKSLSHSLLKWKLTHELPWLVAAMTADPGKETAAITMDAESINPDSPAYLTAAYFRVRSHPEDHQLMQSVLAMDDAALPHSTRNRFLKEKWTNAGFRHFSEYDRAAASCICLE